MTRLLLVRHAEPAAFWGDHDDPGLSEVGVRQADDLASRLTENAPRTVVSSPLARARGTAAALAERIGVTARIDPSLSEVPTPAARRADRTAWLRDALGRRWPELDEPTQAWRARLLAALGQIEDDTVVFTHFVAINVAVGAATDDGRVRCCSPAHCSVTELATHGQDLTLQRLGAEATSPVG